MSAQTLVPTPKSSTVVGVLTPFSLVSSGGGGSRRRAAVALLAGGLAAVGLAAVGLTALAPDRGFVATTEEVPPPSALTLTGLEAVSVVPQTYDPGQDSGWHTHSGIHAVAVLSGTLTVYDATCGRHSFAAGSTYVGGQDPHLARNEAAEPVEMIVTYLTPSTSPDSTRHAAVPTCWGRSDV